MALATRLAPFLTKAVFMPTNRPTLSELEAFEAVARIGGVDGAAKALGLTSGAVDDALDALERRLGVRLFESVDDGAARLSAQGTQALGHARKVLAACDALLVLAPNVRPGTIAPKTTQRAIVIGTHAAIFASFRPAMLSFEEEFADRPLSVDFDCPATRQVAVALADGRIDLALFYATGEPRGFASDYLWSERWTLFVGEGHRLAARGAVGRSDLVGEALLMPAPGSRLQALVGECLVKGGLGALGVLAESDDYARLAEHCRAGAAILPAFGEVAARIAAMPGIRRLAYVDQIPTVDIRLAVAPRAADDDVVGALADMLKRSLR